MCDDWQSGDDALCIAQMYQPNGDPSTISIGQVKRVNDITNHFCGGCGKRHDYLIFVGMPGEAFSADAFIKLRPHEEDEEDREVIMILKGTEEYV